MGSPQHHDSRSGTRRWRKVTWRVVPGTTRPDAVHSPQQGEVVTVRRAFTLIELLVVIAMMSLLTF
jgi:prepilin-type N-terminal cleavage/methylation domain-containing protein